ncbi:MarR family winged helix-turn-helix transcriptional regulator [Micromonospora arborensis]|uniref:MarR family winged helix-turn-helix transcriptional regulator n=1 Tax=Micromonospora arborensis TaxID=2116518 RepID=UPI0037155217
MSDVPGAPADLLRSLTRAERLLSRRLGAVLADDALTIEAWRVLCLLADGQGHPMSEVSAEASLPPGTLTKLVDQLVDRNLVFRRIDPMDRRRIRAYLTARGRREHARLDERVRASLAELGISPTAESQTVESQTAESQTAESQTVELDGPSAAGLVRALDDLIDRLDPARRATPATRLPVAALSAPTPSPTRTH